VLRLELAANGAGKTTLLKDSLARVTPANRGFSGKSAAAVGKPARSRHGFSSGADRAAKNTFLNGAILGMGKKEIERKFDRHRLRLPRSPISLTLR